MINKLSILYTFAFFAVCGIAQAQVSEFSFDNGLKLLVKEDHRAPIVVSQIWYKVGSSYEHDGITGVSHVLEHMMFKGTKKHGPGEFSQIIAANGGSENAFTSTDYTAYFQTMEKSRLPISFELEADRMSNLTLPTEEFIKEIEVVKEERRMRTEDSPTSFTQEVAMATAYQTGPYRFPIIGTMADLDAMSVNDLKDWYQKWYAPNNATIVVVGDVIPKEVQALAQKYFGNLPAEEIVPNRAQPEVEQQGIKRINVKRQAEVPSLSMLYKIPVLKTALANPDIAEEWELYALDVLAGVLDGGNSARFSSRLVRGSEVANSVGIGFNMMSRLDSVLSIGGTPSRGKTVDDLEQAIRKELEQLKIELVDKKEMDRVKAQVVSQDVYEKDSAFYQGMVLGTLETVGLSWRIAGEYVEKIQLVTPEQIRFVANKYFVDDHLTVATLDPQSIDKQAGQQAQRGAGSAQ